MTRSTAVSRAQNVPHSGEVLKPSSSRVRPSFHVVVTDWTEHVGSDSDDTDSQLFLCVYEMPLYSLLAINQVQEHSAPFSCL